MRQKFEKKENFLPQTPQIRLAEKADLD